jgi:hypothetical protein
MISPERVTVTTFLILTAGTILADTLKKEFQSIYPDDNHIITKSKDDTRPRIKYPEEMI